MDREQFKKEFEQFSKEFNEELKRGLIDGVIMGSGKGEKLSLNKEDAERFFKELFSLADSFGAMNKKEGTKDNDFSSSIFKTPLYQIMKKEYAQFINSNYKQSDYYSNLISDKAFEGFYSEFLVSLGSFMDEYVDASIKKMIKEEGASIRFSPVKSREEAILALLSGKIVIDETMKRDGTSFYAYKDGSFYRIEADRRPIVVDIGKVDAKEFFVMQ